MKENAIFYFIPIFVQAVMHSHKILKVVYVFFLIALSY